MQMCSLRTGIAITVSASDRLRLETIVKGRNAPQKHVLAEPYHSSDCGWSWHKRYHASGRQVQEVHLALAGALFHEGVDGLLRDKPGRSAPHQLRPRVEGVVALTLKPPPHEATYWTAQAIAKGCGLAVSTVQKIWRDHLLAPHRWRVFKLSNHP